MRDEISRPNPHLAADLGGAQVSATMSPDEP